MVAKTPDRDETGVKRERKKAKPGTPSFALMFVADATGV
jgi:hypothetical protein